MKNKIYTFMYLSLGFFILGCNSENKSNNDYDSTLTTKISKVESSADSIDSAAVANPSQFIMTASASGLLKVEAAKMALEKGHDEMIKIFANQMIKDNVEIIKELDGFAKLNKIVVPSKLSPQVFADLNTLKKMDSGVFDARYISLMIDEHKKDLALFKSAATFQDAKLKDLAERKLNIVELNASMAADIQFNLVNKSFGFLK